MMSAGLPGCQNVHDRSTPTPSSTATEATATGIAESLPLQTTMHVKETSTVPASTEEPITKQIWVCDCLPQSFVHSVEVSLPLQIARDESSADLFLGPVTENPFLENWADAHWVYLLTAPFPTLTDSISEKELTTLWQKGISPVEDPLQIVVSDETLQLFEVIWGEPDPDVISVLPANELLATAWEERAWAIIPFDEIDPRWKVIRVDGVSPLDSDFDHNNYALSIHFGISAVEDSSFDENLPGESISYRDSNFEVEKLTSLILTGTTALARYTAQRMEEKGVIYPASDIAHLLLDADFTHISNEVPFDPKCPPADPVRLEQRFCSDPRYFELLTYIDVDVIELTGNHILDWGVEPLLGTIELYEENGIPYYGGGKNLEDARRVLSLQMTGNSLYLMGCSQAGPDVVWATEDSPGSNPCDDEWLKSEIETVLRAGGIPVVTFQHLEVEDYTPHSSQRIDFLRAAEMGAVIVSGSQSHFAQTMTFFGDHFVHYGLGNLFFDQMYGENPKEFIDRHYFYNGQYVSTELITTILEDAAKPRLMSENERRLFLSTIFEHCNWSTVFIEQ